MQKGEKYCKINTLLGKKANNVKSQKNIEKKGYIWENIIETLYIIGGKQMSDSFITVVLILIASVLIFIVPVAAVSARNDKTATQNVQVAVTSFADSIREKRNNKTIWLWTVIRRDTINWKYI